MNLLAEKGVISEIECGSNFAYVLSDNSGFLSTEYKVLQNQTDSSLIKCMKMLYNGKIELYYLTDLYKPLSGMFSRIDPDQFITIVGNLLAGIIEVKNNGFLTCHSIDSSFEHIYVDQNTFKVALVYLPLNKHEYSDSYAFENALRANLVRVISAIPTLSSPKTMKLSSDLQNGMLSIEDIYSMLGGNSSLAANQGLSAGQKNPSNMSTRPVSMKLVALNAPTVVEVVITKPEFFIGKKDTNDGIISFNKMISRVHCKVSTNGECYMISDLQSVNGTFVNGARLQPNQPVQLRNGDVVRLANSDFRVVIG